MYMLSMHKRLCSPMHITSGYVLDMFSDLHIPLTVVWYLVYNEYCTWHTTSDDEQIITISHLVLQVYCSPSLKEYLYNPVMTLLARNMERRGSILCAHGGVCACVCVWWLYVHTHTCLCVACAWVCGDVCMHISVCICVSAIRTVDTNLQCMYMYQQPHK